MLESDWHDWLVANFDAMCWSSYTLRLHRYTYTDHAELSVISSRSTIRSEPEFCEVVGAVAIAYGDFADSAGSLQEIERRAGVYADNMEKFLYLHALVARAHGAQRRAVDIGGHTVGAGAVTKVIA